MDFKFDKTTDVTAELTVVIEPSDYQDRTTKAMKDIRRNAQLPGFRKGQVPMSILQKRFGMGVKQEEVQKLLDEGITKYISENNINVLGNPLPSSKQPELDLAADSFTFVMDLAIAPEFDATVSSADKIPFYTVAPTDDNVNAEIDMHARRLGHYEDVETYVAGDMVKGHLAQLDADGNILEGGYQKEDATFLPTYFRNDDQKRKFDNLQVNTVLTINLADAYDGNATEIAALLGIDKEAAAELKSDFSLQVTNITRYVPAPVDQTLFDSVFGEGKVTDEAAFREAVRSNIVSQFEPAVRRRFIADLRKHLVERIGTLQWPEEILKRIIRASSEGKDEEYIQKSYDASVEGLLWQLIQDQLTRQTGITIERSDILDIAKEMTRAQFAQYGMGYAPDDLVERYANQLLQDQKQTQRLAEIAIEDKLATALQPVVTLEGKTVTPDEFSNL